MYDITGYGLLGHLLEMCEASNVSATIEFNSIPYISALNWHKVVLSLEEQNVI